MSDQSKGLTCRITGGGIAALHPPQEVYTVLAGPSTSKEFNTIKANLRPQACWRLEDVRFEFDSSFVTPAAAEEFKHLVALMKEHPGAPLSIFGHADPVGDEEYNKKLSGRRATAVYGMLTRNTDLWEELYSNPLGRDDWKTKVVQIILLDLGYSPGSTDGKKSPETTEAIKKFQADHGLPPSGNADRATRAKLFLAYMDKHCRDADGNPFKAEKKDFLAQGADSGGKGDYQGCGEFNPLLMFSREENEEYKKEENKEKRNAENAPNRRVLVYLFRPGRHVNPQAWPCPRVKEGVAGCYKRFWSDAPKRRTFQEKRREYDKTHDTFACRFYDRLAIHSPCETIMRIFRIRLFDPFARPIPYAPFRIVAESALISDWADGQGWASGKADEVPDEAVVEWGYPAQRSDGTVGHDKAPKYVYRAKVYITINDKDEQKAAEQRLNNLGYFRGKTFEDKIRAFQSAYDMPETGRLEDIKEQLRNYHDTADPEPLPESNPGTEQ
jgi:peptidoglycan hydrolase-like protein with peptidoglycan-binding domain